MVQPAEEDAGRGGTGDRALPGARRRPARGIGGGLERVRPGTGVRHLGGFVQRSGEARRRVPAARGVPARRRVLRASLPLEGLGGLGWAAEDRRRPEADADSAALIDFFFAFSRCISGIWIGHQSFSLRMSCILGYQFEAF